MGDTEESDYAAWGTLPVVTGPSSPTPWPFSLWDCFSLEAVLSLLIAWEPLMHLNQAALGLACHLRHLLALPPSPRWSPRGH